jgi:2-polyprenyl-3-methyl-5-hydroxy-6-metoxy-1,4-benzoquinol methylase
MNDRPLTFSQYRIEAIGLTQKILREGLAGEYDEQALPAYPRRNRLMRWLFWQRLRRVVRYFNRCVSPGSKVLDFGCGVRKLIPLLSWRGYKVTGIDLDIRHTQSFLNAFHVHDASIPPADGLSGRADHVKHRVY